MKKEYVIEGMSCNHCRMSAEKALNSIEGITAEVSLNPPMATIEFHGPEKTLEVLQTVLANVGDFVITEKPL